MPSRKGRRASRREPAPGAAPSTPGTAAPGARKRPAPSPAAPSPAPASAASPPPRRRSRRSSGAQAARLKKQWLDELADAPHNAHVLLLDLDNWPTFFSSMTWTSLPSNVYIAACYRNETFAKETHCHQLHGPATAAMLANHRLVRVPSLSSKDSADSNVIALAKDVERVIQQRDGLSRLWVTIISGDHIFKQTQETMSRSLPVMRCAERDYGHLAVLLTATGTCTLPQPRPGHGARGGSTHGSSTNASSGSVGERRQKRARVTPMSSGQAPAIGAPAASSSASTLSSSVTAAVAAAAATRLQPAASGSCSSASGCVDSTKALGPLSVSSIQFNVGTHGSTISGGGGSGGGANGHGIGRSNAKRHTNRNSRRRRDAPTRCTTARSNAAVPLGAWTSAAISQTTDNNSGSRDGSTQPQQPQTEDWPALPKPSPVKLSFAQAVALHGVDAALAKAAANSSAAAAAAAGGGGGGARVYRFGQQNGGLYR